MTVVLILGAGFSRAISDAAPLTDELGNLVVSRMSDDRLPAHPRGFEGGSFEVWLSRLGEDQPDLSVEANLLNGYWVPGDASGATIHRWDLFGSWGQPEPVDQDRLRRELPGRSPFIVPPTAAKSA